MKKTQYGLILALDFLAIITRMCLLRRSSLDMALMMVAGLAKDMAAAPGHNVKAGMAVTGAGGVAKALGLLQVQAIANFFNLNKWGSIMAAKKIYMVRTYSAGVFYGEVVSRKGDEIKMKNARRVWRWAGAASLSELATLGTSKPKECKFPVAVAEVVLLGVIEIVTCTPKAVKSLKEVAIWTHH